MGFYQSPFTPAFDTPSTEGSGVTSRGGMDLPDGRKETPNQSEIPLQPDTYTVGPGDPGKDGSVPLPSLDNRTIPTRKD
jgi:hypothetical protein